MKRLLIVSVLMLVTAVFGYSQDSTFSLTYERFKITTLTPAYDTADVYFGADNRNYESYSMTVYTTTGADTLTVWTKSWAGALWTQVGLIDLSTGENVSSIVASTTKKEFTVLDPEPYVIRIISSSNDASNSVVLVTGKRGEPYVGTPIGGLTVTATGLSTVVTNTDSIMENSKLLDTKLDSIIHKLSDTLRIKDAWGVETGIGVFNVLTAGSDTVAVPASSKIIGFVFPAESGDTITALVSYTSRTPLTKFYSTAGTEFRMILDTLIANTIYISESTSVGFIRYFSLVTNHPPVVAKNITVIYKRD